MEQGGEQEAAAAPGSATYVEIKRRGERQPRRQRLDGTRIALGRSADARVWLGDATISRLHAEILCDPFGRWWIRDLGSTNGTVVNGESVTEQVLRHGDAIGIGDFTLRIFTETAAQSTGVPAKADADEGPRWIQPVSEDEQAVQIDASQLSALKSFGRKLLAMQRPGERLLALCELMRGNEFRASSASVVRLALGTAPSLLAGPWAGGASQRPPRISNAVTQALLETRAPILGTHAAARRWKGSSNGIRKLSMAGITESLSVVSCPIRERTDGSLDALYVEVTPDRGTLEWLSLVSLAVEAYRQADLVWETRRELQHHAAATRELEMAQQIQRAYLCKPPRIRGLDVNVGFEPCKWVGGDYVDVLQTSEGRVLLAMADVCGKGLHAAIVASSLHTMVHATVEAGGGPALLMERLNAHLTDFLPSHSFVTMSCVVVEPETGELECFNAGHLPALVVNPRTGVRLLPSGLHPPLGLVQEVLQPMTERLAPGEVLILFTDGLAEGYGEGDPTIGMEAMGRGVAEFLAAEPEASCARIGERLWRMLEDFRGDRWMLDDTTFLVVRRTAAG